MAKERIEIYPSKKNMYENEMKNLEKSDLSLNNKNIIKQYQNYLFSQDIGKQRITKLSNQLRKICEYIKSDLKEITKDDLLSIISFYNQRDNLAEETKNDYRRSIKQFFKWYKREDERLDSEETAIQKKAIKFYEHVMEIKTTCKLQELNPSTIITDEDVDTVVENGCLTYREKSLIKFLHETGCRAGELLNITIEDISFSTNYATVRLDGKTGQRHVFVLHSLPLLTKWLDVHPLKHDKSSKLWVTNATNYKNMPLRHSSGQKIINQCFKKANMAHKRHNYHWFRHSRATLLAPDFPEVILCDYMGWIRGSRQIRRYVHLCPKQIESAFLEHNGLGSSKRKEQGHKKCSCGTINDNISRFCRTCARPVDVAILMQQDAIRAQGVNKTIQILEEMLINPEIAKQINQIISKERII